jgi:hypothetical protein
MELPSLGREREDPTKRRRTMHALAHPVETILRWIVQAPVRQYTASSNFSEAKHGRPSRAARPF